jgi:DNA-directed RNA polymerase subunit RPC12/RpoP
MRLLKRDDVARDLVVDVERIDADDPLRGIRCPACAWRPEASSLWSCLWTEPPEPRFDWCGTVWNTFLTRGRCPGCGHQWQWTSCLRCAQWSRHDEWYERRD